MLLNTKIPFSYILKKIKHELIYVIIIAIFVKFLAIEFSEYLPEMPLGIPAFFGTAITIILSFKLNQSYDRWWEARKVWGAIVNDSRSLVLLLQSFLSNNHSNEIKQITNRHIAWCYSLGQHLRKLDPIDGNEKYFTTFEIDKLKNHINVPLAILQLNALQLAELKNIGELSEYNHVQLTSLLMRYSDSMGMAERIKNTVFPVTYRKLLHFMIYIFVISLSLALGEINGIFEIPLLIIVSSTFLLLEKTATHMQDPFENRPTDTNITAIATTIEINLKQLINDFENVPKIEKSTKFYSL